MMNMNVANPSDALLDDLSEEMIIDQPGAELTDIAPAAPRRDLPAMMRKIPVTLTLEVGSARISLEELMNIGADSVVELDVLAGEPLVIIMTITGSKPSKVMMIRICILTVSSVLAPGTTLASRSTAWDGAQARPSKAAAGAASSRRRRHCAFKPQVMGSSCPDSGRRGRLL